jgi:hypothetical protein
MADPSAAVPGTVPAVSILSWIFVGLFAGLLARWIVKTTAAAASTRSPSA